MGKFLKVLFVGSFSLALCALAMADQGTFVASKNSTKYHLATCSVVKQITKDNLVSYKTPEEAIKAGYSPCQKCNPPTKSDYLVGSKNSTVYHTPTCALANKISSENMVYFPTKGEAVKAGYKPCQICFPFPAPSKASGKNSKAK